MYDINALHPHVKELALKLVQECQKQGLQIKITDCVRTKAEQDALYAQGRTQPGSIVTNAQYPQSNHCWGIAFDFCRNDGTGAYNESGNFFERVGAVGKSIGLFWGGDFTTILDRPHFEYQGYGVWADLQAKYGTPEVFFASWGQSPSPAPAPDPQPSGYDYYVHTIQVSLNDDGYKDADGKALSEDGIMGERTRYAMSQVHINNKSAGAMQGWFQTYINMLKEYNLVYDGVYGNASEKACRVFQARHGLTVDGVVGKDTLSKMLELLTAGYRGTPDVPVRAANGAGYINVRTGAGTNYGLLTDYPRLNNGNKFDVIGQGKDNAGELWYKILIADQYVGWVKADLTVKG